MKALVTGGAGFIGSHMFAPLREAGYEVSSVDFLTGDDARDFFRRGHEPFDLVVHCAAIVGGRRWMDRTPIHHAVNLETDAALFSWAARVKPGRVVYFSSSCAYPVDLGFPGHRMAEDDIDLRHPRWPDQLYGWAKLTGELLAATCRDTGVPVTVVRPFSVYGPGMKDGFAIPGFLSQVRKRADPLVIWGDANQVRDYIHVADVCEAVVALVKQGADGPVNLGTGRATSLTDLAGMMATLAGYSPQVKVDEGMPAGVASLVADTTRLREHYEPRRVLEDYLAEVVTTTGRG